VKKRFEVVQILSNNQIKDILEIYNRTEGNWAHQDYNLFDVETKHLHKDSADYEYISKALESRSGRRKPRAHYFVKYEKDSFASLHFDSNSKITMVTLLEEKDLKGGHTIVFEKYTKTSRPAERYAKRPAGKHPLNKDIIPVVVDSKVGDTMIYDEKLSHCVSHISNGSRLVLVSWFL